MNDALILFAHGARDARWAQPFQRLQAKLTQSRPELQVRLAFLEFMQPDLPALLAELYQLGVRQTILVPVFLGQGGHVLRELPVLIAEAQLKHPDLQIRLVDAVGECDTVLSAIADYCLSQCDSVSNPVV